MNKFLLILSLTLIPLITGCGIVKAYLLIKAKILKADAPERESAFCRLSVYFSSGTIVLLALAGLINMLAVFTNMTISKSGRIYLACVISLTLIAALFSFIRFLTAKNNRKNNRAASSHSTAIESLEKNSSDRTSADKTSSDKNSSDRTSSDRTSSAKASSDKYLPALIVTAIILCAIQIVRTALGSHISYLGDQTVETVMSFISTDKIYSVDPLTGLPYINGYPFRLSLQCLPFLYSVLCNAFSIMPTTLVWHIIPVFWLICGYSTISCLADSLFKKSIYKIGMFSVFVLLLWCSDAAAGATGYDILHSGYSSTVVLELLLIYWTLGMIMSGNAFCALLAIATEPLIASTQYGVGACLLITVLCVILSRLPIVKRIITSIDGRTGGSDGKA